jgi:hypothetical protein
MIRYAMLALATTILVACGGAKEEPKGVIPQHQLDSMNKAEDVEAMMQQSEQQRREQMDNR